jgi:hypothetical protein
MPWVHTDGYRRVVMDSNTGAVGAFRWIKRGGVASNTGAVGAYRWIRAESDG